MLTNHTAKFTKAPELSPDINSLVSLTEIIHLNREVKTYRDMINRVKKFEHQLYIIKDNEGIEPKKIKTEIIRIKKMAKYYHLNYLINNNSKIKTIKKELNQWPTILEHWQKLTNRDYYQSIKPLTELQKTMLETLEESSIKARKHQIMWRLKLQLNESIYQQWFVIFNTLTVSTENYKTVWEKKSKVFKEYLYQFDKITCKENHIYFAVTESGAINNREHIHIIHILKTIPNSWKSDPNKGHLIPYRRIIEKTRTLWKYGYSSPIAVRFNAADAWSQINWAWPVVKKEDKYIPIDSGNGDRLASYVAKYLTKTLEKKESKQWKLRMTQRLGLSIINQSMKQLTIRQLRNLLTIQKMNLLTIQEQKIPPQILKTAIHRQLNLQLRNDNNSTQLMNLTAQPSIMKRLQNLTQETNQYNWQNITSLSIKKLSSMAISEIQEIIDNITIKLLGTKTINPKTFITTGLSNRR